MSTFTPKMRAIGVPVNDYFVEHFVDIPKFRYHKIPLETVTKDKNGFRLRLDVKDKPEFEQFLTKGTLWDAPRVQQMVKTFGGTTLPNGECVAIRSGCVQGQPTSNHAGRPRCAAASTRTAMSGRPGHEPSHAARLST